MNGGRIPWNVTAIGEIFRINFQLGKHIAKGGSECHLKDQQHRLEQWSNITFFLRKTRCDCIRSAQKSCQIYFLGNAFFAGVSGKDIMVEDIEELEQMDVSEIHARRLNAKEVLTPRSGNFIFPVADGTVKIFG